MRAASFEQLKLHRLLEGNGLRRGSCNLEVQGSQQASHLRGKQREKAWRDAIRASGGRGPHGQAKRLRVEERRKIIKVLRQVGRGPSSPDTLGDLVVGEDLRELDVGKVLLPSFPHLCVILRNGAVVQEDHGEWFEGAFAMEPRCTSEDQLPCLLRVLERQRVAEVPCKCFESSSFVLRNLLRDESILHAEPA